MRQLKMEMFCDICGLEDDDARVPATTAYVVGISKGDTGRPVPKVLDLCSDHAGPLDDLAELMGQIDQLPDPAPARAPVKAAVAKPPPSTPDRTVQCPVCGSHCNAMSLLVHVWGVHRPDPKPPAPKRCPECGKAYPKGPGMASHRRLAHGYDALADALSGVPGYKPSKSKAKGLPTGQLELDAS